MKSRISRHSYPFIFCTFLCFLFARSASCQGIITTIAGDGITQYIGDGYPATIYSLAQPGGMCMDKKGNLIIADNFNARIRLLTPGDTISTIIGDSTVSYSGDGGPASAALLGNPVGVFMDTSGNLYITDWYNAVVRKVDARTGIINTICGSGVSGFGGDGGMATLAKLESIGGAVVDKSGNIYIPDYGNERIRKVNAATGIINTIAGTGATGYSGDGGPATSAQLSGPNSICLDTAGNIYFSEYNNHVVRKIDAVTGIISTVAGRGTYGYSGDGGPATAAYLDQPNYVFSDFENNLLISDKGNNVIRLISPSGTIKTIAGSGLFGMTGDGGSPLSATFNRPTSVFEDTHGVIYIGDGGNSAIRKIQFRTTGIEQPVTGNFTIYPNPSNGHFFLTATFQLSEYNVEIYNLVGQLVFQKRLAGSQEEISIEGCAPGMYLVRCTGNDLSVVQKVIVK